MENLINYIKPELLVLAVLLYGLGLIIKKTKLKDNFIPIVLGGVGIILAVTYCLIMEGVSFASFGVGVIQGLLCASTSTYVNQIIKQMKKLGVPKTEVVEDIIEAVEKSLDK